MSDKPDSTGWSASNYNQVASFVYSSQYTAPVLELLKPEPGERIADFGCGSGELSIGIERIVKEKDGGLVVGIDNSDSMIEKAKANGLQNAFVGDLQALDVPAGHEVGTFDAIFTNATLHWCKRDPSAVLQNAKKFLKPGGRIAGEFGGFMNCIGVRAALTKVLKERGHNPEGLDPWFFPSVADYRQLLEANSFHPKHVELVPRLTPVEAGLYAWLELFVKPTWLKGFGDSDAAEILREVEEFCKVDQRDRQGNWSLMYVRLRFSAVLE